MSGRGAEPGGYRERNSTADRALDILQMFSEEKPVWSGAEIARQLGVARSTGYRYLLSLIQSGFLEEGSGGFQLGPRIFQLARAARRGIGLSEVALPVMRELAGEVNETVLLTRRSGSVVVCLERVEAARAIRLSYERGHVLPINAGAAAQVLLAWAPPAEAARVLREQPLQRFTARTLTDPEQLEARLERIRADGFALSRGELDPDVLGIAAPIRGDDETLRAAVSIAAVSSRVSDEQAEKATASVLAAAATISERLAGIEA